MQAFCVAKDHVILRSSRSAGTPMTKSTSSADALSHARRLLDKLPLVDGHNDLPFVIRRDRDAKGDVRRFDLERRVIRTRHRYPSAEGRQAQRSDLGRLHPLDTKQPARAVLELIDTINQLHEAHPDVFMRRADGSRYRQGEAPRQDRVLPRYRGRRRIREQPVAASRLACGGRALDDAYATTRRSTGWIRRPTRRAITGSPPLAGRSSRSSIGSA